MPVWGAVISNNRSTISWPTFAAGCPRCQPRHRRRCRRGRGLRWRAPRFTSPMGASTAMGQTALAASPTRSRKTRRSLPSPASPSARNSIQTQRSRPSSVAAASSEGADREHAPLGRHHPAGSSARARRLPEDAEVAEPSRMLAQPPAPPVLALTDLRSEFAPAGVPCSHWNARRRGRSLRPDHDGRSLSGAIADTGAAECARRQPFSRLPAADRAATRPGRLSARARRRP